MKKYFNLITVTLIGLSLIYSCNKDEMETNEGNADDTIENDTIVNDTTVNDTIISDTTATDTTTQDNALNSSDYHVIRAGLKNCYIKFKKDKKGRVAFLGGSITQRDGWRDSMHVYFENRFPETLFDFVDAGIGSMGTTSGAFRLERDVLKDGPVDLIFVEAAVNDRAIKRTSAEQIDGMEGIFRHILDSDPATDIINMHFVDKPKMADYRKGNIPEVIINHENVSEHYNVSTINLAKEVTDRIDNQEFTWEDDFLNLHPSPFGHEVYARSMRQMLDNVFSGYSDSEETIVDHIIPEKISTQCYDKGYLIEAATIAPATGWFVDPLWKPTDGAKTRENYVDVPMLICESLDNIQTFDFEGKAVGIAIAQGPDAATIEYRIDLGSWIKLNLDPNNKVHLPSYHTLAIGLDMTSHNLEIKIVNDPEKASSACRIRYFYVNSH